MSWDHDAPPPAWVPALALGAAIYRGGLAMRRAAYAIGLIRPERAAVPVISVGNLTAGGNGKTPLVIDLVERLRARGRTPAVVTRGYGAPNPTGIMVVGPTTSWREAGDEPVLIARRTDALVIVSPDRARGAELAVDRGADVIVLDDGFQHWRLARTLDLVLVDARLPFSNGHVLPWGRLREPRSALSRANLIIAHRGDVSAPASLGALTADVEVAIEVLGLDAGGQSLDLASLRGMKVALAAGIARPERLVATVRTLGAEIVATHFVADHAPIDPAALRGLAARADRVIVTEKDAVRLLSDAPVAVLSIALVVLTGEDALESAIGAALSARAIG